MSPILEAVGLSKSFLQGGQTRLILEDASLSLNEGEFLSIIGSSGCGKSTFLELLAGVTRPDKGRIVYKGEDVTGKGGKLGYMPQDDLLFPWLSVRENALLPVRVANKDIRSAQKRIDELLPVFGLSDHAGHLPWQLSGGLRQRTALLRTCMTEARLLLLDEPYASLDAITRRQLQLWLKGIAKNLGLSVILVTHDISEAMLLSDRLIIMQADPGRFDLELEVPGSAKEGDPAFEALKSQVLGRLGLEQAPEPVTD